MEKEEANKNYIRGHIVDVCIEEADADAIVKRIYELREHFRRGKELQKAILGLLDKNRKGGIPSKILVLVSDKITKRIER